MERKEYLINGNKFYLKEYGELTGIEEEKINAVLYSDKKRDDIELNISGYEIFPLILVPENHLTDINNFEWKNLKNKQMAEILIDFIVEKKTSQDSILSYMKELTKLKLQQSENMKENTGSAEHTEKKNPFTP